MKHDLKIWPEYYEAVLNGSKRFELRYNDRNYQVGDILRLKEYDDGLEVFTGRALYVHVDYVLSRHAGLTDGYALLSITFMQLDLMFKLEIRTDQ